MQQYRLTLFSVFASAILMVTLVCPQNALAQDETPPPDSSPTQTTGGNNDATPGDAAPTDAPAVTDQPAATDGPAATQASAATDEATAKDEATATDEPAATLDSAATNAPAPASVSEILDQVPDGTDVVVLGADGQPEPLVSQAAAETIVNGDPMWCPTGVLPGGLGCTSHFTSFTDLITELATFNESGAGTIYIASDYDATPSVGPAPDAGTDIIFDYGAVGLTDLIFQGGWNGLPGGSAAIVGTSDLTGIKSLQFWDWGAFGFPGSLTLRDILLSGGDRLYIGDSDPSSPITTANVSLENVSVTGTNLGTFIGTDGAVTVTDGNFSGNAADGLDVEAGGNITLNNVTANGNHGIGANLESCGCLGAGNITVLSVDANDNHGLGIVALSGGDVTMSDTDTFRNHDAGILVGNGGNVALTGLDSEHNGDIGVEVFSAGNVSIANSWLGFNDAFGFDVGNGGNVTLANSAFFDNTDPGAYITSDGSVKVSNSFFGNCFFGVSMCEDQPVGLFVDSLGPVNISNSQFSQNTDPGLVVQSDSDVLLNNVTASGNYVGVVVQTPGNVRVCGGSYSYNDRFGFTSTAGTVFMSEQTIITGNGDAPIDLGPGTTVVTYDCAKKTGDYKLVNVSDGQSVEVSCEDGQIGVELRLPNSDSLIVPCPMRGPASLSSVAFSQLPEGLPDGFTFVSGLHARAARDGLTVSFDMPSPDASYTILYWNGAAWVELQGVTSVDGMFAVVPVSPGVYVLATK